MGAEVDPAACAATRPRRPQVAAAEERPGRHPCGFHPVGKAPRHVAGIDDAALVFDQPSSDMVRPGTDLVTSGETIAQMSGNDVSVGAESLDQRHGWAVTSGRASGSTKEI